MGEHLRQTYLRQMGDYYLNCKAKCRWSQGQTAAYVVVTVGLRVVYLIPTMAKKVFNQADAGNNNH